MNYPSAPDLIPGCAQKAIDEAKWFVLWYKRNEVFCAISVHETDERIWHGQTLDLCGDNTFDVAETSLGLTFLQRQIETGDCHKTDKRVEVDLFFQTLYDQQNKPWTPIIPLEAGQKSYTGHLNIPSFKIVGTNQVLRDFEAACLNLDLQISKANSYFRDDFEHCLMPAYAYDNNQPRNVKLQTMSSDAYRTEIVYFLPENYDQAIAMIEVINDAVK